MSRSRSARSSLSSEWRIFMLVMLAFAAMLGSLSGLGQADRFVYDTLIRASQRPANADIIIIGIDKHSISSLGRWPWQRRTHADLIDVLTQSNLKALGMDIIFSEQELSSDDDAVLTKAIARNHRIVLPLLIERSASGLTLTRPLQELVAATHDLGHVHFNYDVDGVVRSVYLQESVNEQQWPHFALAIFNTGKQLPASVNKNYGIYYEDASQPDIPHLAQLKHDAQERIPFAGAPGHFRTLSYVDVLAGKYPPSTFDGKYVLIGPTASGLATMFPTPLTSDQYVMSGIEVHANILAGLLDERGIHDVPSWLNSIIAVMFTLAALLACRYLPPFNALCATLGLLALIFALTFFLFIGEWWLPPSAALLMALSVYPLWNWRRLEATLAYIGDEFARLHSNTPEVFRKDVQQTKKADADFMDRQIGAVKLAADHAWNMQQFIVDSLDSMPDATLVLSRQGQLMMCNRAARDYFATLSLPTHALPTLEEIFANFLELNKGALKLSAWRERLLREQASSEAMQIEARDINRREFLIKSAPSRMADDTMLGWIVSLVDVTTLRAAERRREESLNFISHDLRVPQSSILALIQLQRNPTTAFPMSEFLARIEKSVDATIILAESFVHLAKAESQTYHLQDTDLSSILAEATDNMWAYAHSRSIDVHIDMPVDRFWVYVDRSLMVRAFSNLLSNAIKFSDDGSPIMISATHTVMDEQRYVACAIKDHGLGIDPAKHTLIFSPFQRGDDHDQEGVGLGLAFVKMVIDRHAGRVLLDSAKDNGSTFTILLPISTGSSDEHIQPGKTDEDSIA